MSCNLKTTKLLDCALISVCAAIRSNTVCVIKKRLFEWHCVSPDQSVP